MIDWYVVHTHVNAEPKATEHLRRQGFEVYMPQTRRWRTHARRRDLVLRPLFPRYVFVGFDVDRSSWRSIFSTVGVATLICRGELPSKVPSGILDELRQAERAGSFDDANAVKRLNPGDSVRLVRGPFSDLVGQLQALVSTDRVRVLLEILGRQVSTIVDAAEVQPA